MNEPGYLVHFFAVLLLIIVIGLLLYQRLVLILLLIDLLLYHILLTRNAFALEGISSMPSLSGIISLPKLRLLLGAGIYLSQSLGVIQAGWLVVDDFHRLSWEEHINRQSERVIQHARYELLQIGGRGLYARVAVHFDQPNVEVAVQ